MDKKMDFWPAMELSRKVVQKHLGPFLLFLAATLLVFLAGLLLCGVGIFVTIAITTAAIVFAYEDIFNPSPGPGPQSMTGGPPH